nr:SpoIIE family protein phosphatase [Streptomyces meridianus]
MPGHAVTSARRGGMNAFDALPLSGREAESNALSAAVIMADDQGVVTGWSPAAQRLLGHATADVLGRPATDLLHALGGPPFWKLPAGEHVWLGELAMLHLDGHFLRIEAVCYRVAEDDARDRWLLVAGGRGEPDHSGAVHDRAMLDWLFTRSSVALSVYDRELRFVRQNAAMERLCGVTEEERRGTRLPQILTGDDAVAWERRMREVVETGELAASEEIRGRMPADPEADHFYSAVASPLRDAQGRVLGLCTTVSDVTEQHHARERLAMLNEAGTRIGTTLDVMRTAQELADMAVPVLADWINVDLLETLLGGKEPGLFRGGVALRRVANQSVLHGAEALHQPGDVDCYPAHSPPVRCMTTGESLIHEVGDEATRSWLAADDIRADSFAEHGFRYVMCVPVRARGTTLGVTVFLRRSEQPYSKDDRLFAEELVARAAVCLDNARRYTRERTAALELQHNLLPQRLPTQIAVDAASRYLPAGGQYGLGGDWFDVIPLSGARTALVVGDVAGHGINAAATMGRLRTAVRTLADVDLPPDELLTHLDDLVSRLASEEYQADSEAEDLGATCVYAVYDPVSRRCSIARAGHPPPVLVTPDGEARFVDVPPGPPLGLGTLPFEATELELDEDTLIALFTDGFFERQGDMEGGMERLCRALAKPAPSLEELCDSILADVLPEHPSDDVALLVAATRALGDEQVAVRDLPSDPAAVSDARAWAGDRLAEWGLEDAFVTELVVSELVTNAIRYGHGPMQLRLIRDRTLICEVSDASSTAPHLRRARLSDEGGRGLLLVAQLTERWGTRHTRDGKTIWCEQVIPGQEGAPDPLDVAGLLADDLEDVG